VFLTAYEEHARRAFDVEAIDYLVKPVSQSRFDAAVGRLGRRLAAGPSPEPTRLVVTTARGTTMIAVGDIDWIEAADNYARIWTNGRSYLLREALDDLEDRLAAHGFARAHRRALVRVGAVQTLTATARDGLRAVLASGAVIPVSRRRRAGFTRAVKGR
jgi:two-component system LytT family response regulator